jgi:hypothetical protein
MLILWVFVIAAIVWVIRAYVRSNQPGPASPSRTTRRHFRTELRGITHPNEDGTDRQEFIRALSEGEELRLVPDPDNPFDADAVLVMRGNGNVLGYLPAHTEVARKLSVGWRFRTVVAGTYRLRDDSRLGVHLEIESIPPGA